MEYLIRFAQTHESFRRPEIEALASLQGIDIEFLFYDRYSPYAIVKLQDDTAARALIARSILAKDISEFWGQGANYDELHADVRRRTQHRWEAFKHVSFRFMVKHFAAKRTSEEKRNIIQGFTYLGLEGPIRLKNPEEEFCVFEDFISDIEVPHSTREDEEAPELRHPKHIYFGRWLADSSRDLIIKYDLKKRQYISTTSMDAELSLVTANMAHAAPGRLFYDPFVGTGSFCVAAAHFGASTLGSDIDPRSFRGRDAVKGSRTKDPMGLLANFQQYGTASNFVDAFTSDLTNTPLRLNQILDGIVCDPPYGVREGLKVLGTRDGSGKEEVIIDGTPAHYLPGYIAPRKPYGFEAMLNDILTFASRTLVTNGRLSMWMPTTNDEAELPAPMHPDLDLVSVSVQHFNNWSRRLITYKRLPEGQHSDVSSGRQKDDAEGVNANDLNGFRRKYFSKKQEKRLQKEAEQGTPSNE